MKTHFFVLFAVASLLHAQTPRDPIGDNLFPPDFIMANAETIHFTDEQRKATQRMMEKAQRQVGELQEALRRESGAFGRARAQSTTGRTAVMDQFEKFQDRERAMKRA